MMSNKSAATLVIITAQTCGACNTYKMNTENNFMTSLRSFSNNRRNKGLGGIDVININLPSTQPSPDQIENLNRYHPDLGPYLGWFPTFLLFTDSSWKNKQGKLNGVVYNGEYLNGVWKAVGRSPINLSNLMAWINDSITKNDIFTGNLASPQATPILNSSSRLRPIMSDHSLSNSLVTLPSMGSGFNSPIQRIKFGSPLAEEYTCENRSW